MTDATKADPLVSISDLKISYRAGTSRVRVVDGISLHLRPGRTMGVVGESGSGKSTVGQTLLGHLRPGSDVDSGLVEVFGDDVFALTPAALRALRGGRVAMVPQNAGHSLTPSMRIGAQIREALTVHGLPAPQERVLELLAQVHLPDPARLVDRYPHELSGGQQQRVAIARALVNEPTLLLADEPTGNLSSEHGSAILEILTGLHADGMSIVMVTHDPRIADLAERKVEILDGKIVRDGKVEQRTILPLEVPHAN